MTSLSYTQSPYYRPDIDGLRAIAITWVVLCHAFPNYFGGGFIGVDIFFAISGYLISSIIFKGLGKGNFSFLEFYAKRSRRIFPALIFVLVVGLIIGALFLTPREFKEMGKSAFFGSVFFENFKLARGADYFDLSIARNAYMHLWSLGVEEQFYLVFPAIVFVAWKWLKGRILGVLLLMVGLSLATGLYYQPISDSKAYFWPHCRFWQLGAGVLLAYVHYRATDTNTYGAIRRFFERNGTFFSLAASAGLVAILFTYGSVTDAYPGVWAIFPTLCAVFLIASGKEAWFNKAVLSRSSMVYVGWLSYPIYLWHWVFLSIAFSSYAGHIPTHVKWIAILLACLFAYVSFTFIEVPIRKMKADKKMLIGTIVALLGTALLGGAVSKTDGVPQRLSSDLRQALTTITNDRQTPEANRCTDNPIFDCWTQTGKQDGNVLLIGNSHTEHLKSVFASFAPNFARVDIYAAGGTRPLEDVVQRFTEKQLIRDGKAHAVLDAVHRSPAKLVVISNTWGNINPDEEVLLKDGSKSTFEAVFKQTMLNIINSGKKIAFMIDNPTMPNEMENCMGIRPINLTKGECGIARKAYDNQSASQREYFTKWALAYPDQIFVIESGAALCNDECCSMLGKNKEPLYTDTDHLTDAGAKLVSERAWLSITPILKDILEKP